MKKMALTMLLAMPLAMIAVASSNEALATSMFDPGPVDNCGTINCGARIIGGTVLLTSNFAVPWVAEIAARQGECLRIDVTTQDVDFEALLIAPNGTVYRNNNRSAGDLRPLIRVNGLPQNGFYTVLISQASGLPVNADFTLAFGRYVADNAANCLPSTPGL